MAARGRADLGDDPEGRPQPKVPKSLSAKHDSTKRLIVVLERSSLETVKVSHYILLIRAHTMFICMFVSTR